MAQKSDAGGKAMKTSDKKVESDVKKALHQNYERKTNRVPEKSKVVENKDFRNNFVTASKLKRSCYVPIAQIHKMRGAEIIDVIGVLRNVYELRYTKSQGINGKAFRDIVLIDQTNESIMITLWTTDAIKFHHVVGDIISFQNVIVKVYNGTVNLSCRLQTRLTVNPNTTEAQILRNWYVTLKDAEELMANTSFDSAFSPPKESNKPSLPSESPLTSAPPLQTIPHLPNNFVPIKVILTEKQKKERCDVIGIIRDFSPITQRSTRSQISKDTIELLIAADTDDIITATIWGIPNVPDLIQKMNGIIIKKAQVHVFDMEKKLNALWVEVKINPPGFELLFNFYRERQEIFAMPIEIECESVDNCASIENNDETIDKIVQENRKTIKSEFHDMNTEEQKLISINTVKTEIEMPFSEIVTRAKMSNTVESNFISIKTIRDNIAVDSVVDTIAMIIVCSDVRVKRKGEEPETYVRTVTLCDGSLAEIDADLWDFNTMDIKLPIDSIVWLKEANVFYNGESKKLSCPWCNVILNPTEHPADLIRQTIHLARKTASQSFTDRCNVSSEQMDKGLNVTGIKSNAQTVPKVDSVNRKKLTIKFTDISLIQSDKVITSNINILGIIISDINIIRKKGWTTYVGSIRTEFMIADKTRTSIWVSISSEKSSLFKSRKGSVIAFLNINVAKHGGIIQLHCPKKGPERIIESPECNGAKELVSWYNQDPNVKTAAIIPIATLLKKVDENLDFSLKGIVTQISNLRKMKIGCLNDYSRTMLIIDESGKQITLIIWGIRVSKWNVTPNSVVFMSNLRYIKKRRCCIANENSKLQYPIEQAESERLLTWFWAFSRLKDMRIYN